MASEPRALEKLMPRKTFLDGEPLPASDLNSYLMNQAVQTYATVAARNTAITSPSEGQVAYTADSRNLQTYSTQWRPLPFAIQAGKATIIPVANVSTGLAVTWEAGRFAVAPLIVLGVNTTTTAVESITYSGATTSGATIRVVRTNTTSTDVDYLAISMTSSDARG
jgi:hypothetical protein